jgi:phosphoglucosamine mutase
MLAIIHEHIIYGDVLLYLLAKDDETRNIKHKVALSVMTNPGILKAFDDLKIDVYETPVGDSYIIDAIKQGLVTRGAEASGHILTEHLTIGDGILASAKLFDLISRQGLDLVKSWLEDLELYPMETKNLPINKNILKDETIQSKINAIIKDVPKPGKVIVRASGTEDLARITVSLKTQEQVTSMIQNIESLLLGGNK